MTADRWQQIEDLYHSALAQPADSRSTYLDSACAGDPDLLREVRSLLARDGSSGGPIDRPAWDGAGQLLEAAAENALSPGSQLGPYMILSPLGVGGMGEVYRARDIKLDREVAIKVLPALVAQSTDRLARFEREAKVLAALNHPNIAQIYGLEDASGIRALVMELVPGAPITGPLPPEKVIGYARQLAAALDAAHERGIVHRDLKPANIIVTPDGVLKVLDFGLARFGAEDVAAEKRPGDSPTRTGVILGTASYMSPEQARGQLIDQRTDIWAFGVVLYELLTGKRLFTGPTTTDIVAQVITKEPDLSAVPQHLQPLLKRCLEKDPKKRLRHIADWDAYLALPVSVPLASRSHPLKATFTWAIGAALVVAAASVAWLNLGQKPPRAPQPYGLKLHIPENVKLESSTDVILSPDGRHAAFHATMPDGNFVFEQDLNGSEARRLPGTVVSRFAPPVFWSPDSRFVAYSANAPKLRKVDIATGESQDIGDKPGPPIGGTWNREDTIIFGGNNTGLWRMPAGGGVATRLTSLDAAHHDVSHQLPIFLPDGRHFIYFVRSADKNQSGIYATSLDEAGKAPPRRLVTTDFTGYFVPGERPDQSWLLYLSGGSLIAQRFNATRLALVGEPQILPLKIATAYQTALFSATADLLMYRTNSDDNTRQLTWVDLKSGKPVATAGNPAPIDPYSQISPDRTRVADTTQTSDGQSDLWVLDLSRGTTARLTPAVKDYAYTRPVWSPDGAEIIVGRKVAGIWQIVRMPADGSRKEQVVLGGPESVAPWAWSPNGKFLLYQAGDGVTGSQGPNIQVLALETGKPIPSSRAEYHFRETDAVFSPDGRYVGYASEETGVTEVYVRTFSPGGKWVISNARGHAPAWSADGKRLYWRHDLPPGVIMAADIDTSHGFHAGPPMKVIDQGTAAASESVMLGQGRVLLPFPVDTHAGEINVMFNWRSLLK